MQDRIFNHFAESQQYQRDTLESLGESIAYAAQRLVAVLLNDRKILTCGNGRSSASAQLLALAMLHQHERSRPSLPVVALGADAILLSGIANGQHFDEVYAKPLRALGQAGDALVVYAESGHSTNLAKAIAVAHDLDMMVLALTGDHNDKFNALLNENDLELRVPAPIGAHIQEIHTLITHCLCDLIDHQLFG